MSSGFISAEQAEKKRRERQEEWDRKGCYGFSRRSRSFLLPEKLKIIFFLLNNKTV